MMLIVSDRQTTNGPPCRLTPNSPDPDIARAIADAKADPPKTTTTTTTMWRRLVGTWKIFCGLYTIFIYKFKKY